MTNSPKQHVFNPVRVFTHGLLGLFVLVLFCSFANADGIADGFIHGYGFDNTYSDLTGTNSGRPLTISSGTISFTNDGFIGQAVTMQNKGYVRMEDAYKTAFGIADGKDGKMTFLCWYNPSKYVTDGNPLTTNKDWTAGKNVGLIIDAQNKGASGLRYNLGDGKDALNINPNPAVPSTVNEWQFVAITADLSTNEAKLYYGTANGTLELKGSGNTSSIDSLLSNFNYWFIGIDNSGNHYFNGRVDEAGYWNRALSFDEINQVYTAQKAGTSLASQIHLAAAASTIQGGAYTDVSTWANGVAPSVDATVVITNPVTSDSRTFNGDAVIISEGSLTAAGCVYVGHSNDGVAKLTINSGENVFSGKTHNKMATSLIVGYEGGVGKFILNDGSVTTSGYTYIGYTTTAGSEFIQNGGTFNSGDNIGLAYYANEVGSISISGGEMNVNGAIRIGLGANSTGQMTVSGGKVTTIDFQLGLADSGDAAKLEITGGVVEVTGAIYGSGGVNSGNLYVSGTGQLAFNSATTDAGIRELTSFQIEGSGSDGTGALLFKHSLTGASPITLTNNATIGIESGATFTQTAAITETQSSSLTVTGGGTLTLSEENSFTGGTVINSSSVKLTGAGTLGSGPVTVNENGTVEIAYGAPSDDVNISSIEMAKTSSFKVTTGSVTFTTADVALNNLSGGYLVNDQIPNPAPANLTVTGKLTLSNDQLTKFIGSITAPIVEKIGLDTLQLCFDAENAVSIGSLVISSGRVDLKGYMQGSITVNDAVFSPGNSIGEATFGGGFILNEEGATLLMEIGGTEASDNDQLIASLTGTSFASGSVVQFALDANTNYTPSLGDVIEVTMPEVNWDNVTFSSYYFTPLEYDETRGVQLLGVNSNAVPEPSTWALLLLGAAGLMYWRKRKN